MISWVFYQFPGVHLPYTNTDIFHLHKILIKQGILCLNFFRFVEKISFWFCLINWLFFKSWKVLSFSSNQWDIKSIWLMKGCYFRNFLDHHTFYLDKIGKWTLSNGKIVEFQWFKKNCENNQVLVKIIMIFYWQWWYIWIVFTLIWLDQ